MIVLSEDQSLERRLAVLFESAAEFALRGEGLAPLDYEVSFSFVSAEGIQALNVRYRGVDKPTDVLSFPMYGSAEELRAAAVRLGQPHSAPQASARAPFMLGDIVICREVAEGQAEEWGHRAEQELVYLFVHGMLHLLGHGHRRGEGDEALRAMREIGDAVMRQVGAAH